MKKILNFLICLNLINLNSSFYLNNFLLSRRNLISYALFTDNFLINKNIQMNYQLSNNTIINLNYPINNKLTESSDVSEKKNLYSKSNIFFNGELNDETCFKLSEAILRNKNNLLTNPEMGDHINLYIQSPGGSLLPTLAVVDEIINSEIPIYTYIRGYTASAATLLSVAGQYRVMYNHSLMMIHSVRTNQEINSYNEIKDVYENLNIFMKIVQDIYLQNSKIIETDLEKLLAKDSWLTSQQALQYGFIDEIM